MYAQKGVRIMRKRDRWRGMPWIEWIDGDLGSGHTELRGPTPTSMGQYAVQLTREYRRYVEMEAWGDGYSVKVVPALPDAESAPLAIGLSYTGMSLCRILCQACQDLSDIFHDRMAYRVTSREHTRWVS
jgi:hypothetical protein